MRKLDLFRRSALLAGCGLLAAGALANPIIVTTTNDSGPGSLRAAIDFANLNSPLGESNIVFAITPLDGSLKTITPASPLPIITNRVSIDGYTQTNASPNSLTNADNAVLLIELNGANAGTFANGLWIQANNSVIRGLIINRFQIDSGTSLGGHAILLDGASNCVVQGNFIGTDSTGTNALPNQNDAVLLLNAPGNLIGGGLPGQRNLISGNSRVGIGVANPASNGNRIQGNFIGVDATGANALPNTLAGVDISSLGGASLPSASLNLVGGTGLGEGNVISGNGLYGVEIFTPFGGGFGNRIEGNRIGTDADGSNPVPNHSSGVYVTGPSNTIGGTNAAARNIISANFDNGINISDTGSSTSATGNLVVGNYIGTDSTGRQRLGNDLAGVSVVASNNTVTGNLISDNFSGTSGVELGGDHNILTNNLIGVDSTGTNALGNHGVGVDVFGSFNTIVHNTVSGNTSDGIILSGNNNTAIGNFIGIAATGTNVLANDTGVLLSGSSNTVGGVTAADRNIISGNNGAGVAILSGFNVVQGNYIGTDQSGTKAIPNVADGVFLDSSFNNTIGGTSAGAANLIAGNGGNGVNLFRSGSNLIQRNFIGIQTNGTTALGNSLSGVFAEGNSRDLIGGTALAAANTIAFNGSNGVTMVGFDTGDGIIDPFECAVLGNSIFANASLGIDLGGDGVTPNDANCDSDSGPNSLQNFPVLVSAIANATSVTVTGSLQSVGGTTYRIEFFVNAQCDPSGFGQGEFFLGSADVTTTPAPSGGNCTATFDANFLIAGLTTNESITATATDPVNNTSEFSACVAVQAACTITCPADITVNNDPTLCGANVSYPAASTNGTCGPIVFTPASGSFFPVGTSTVTVTNNNGAGCSFTVTVVDQQLPTVLCPANITIVGALGSVSNAVVYPAAPDPVDNCSIQTTFYTPPSGSLFPYGATTVTRTAIDVSGNTNTCQFTVTVNRTAGPAPDLAGSPQANSNGWVAAESGTFPLPNGGTRRLILGAFEVANIGTALATPAFDVQFYLADQPTTDLSQAVLLPKATKTIRKLDAGKTKLIVFGVLPPSQASLSGKFLIAVVDPLNRVLEANEQNNVLVFHLGAELPRRAAAAKFKQLVRDHKHNAKPRAP